MAAREDREHNTLEPVPQLMKPLPTDLGKQVVPHEEKQPGSDPTGKEVVETVANDGSGAPFTGSPRVQNRQSKKKIWIALVVLAMVIFATVFGGVYGSKRKSSSITPTTRPSNLSTTAPSTGSPRRNIAALSFAWNSVNNTRLYFQDNAGQINEAANSASNTTWIIRKTGVSGKNRSAIAAAVSRPNFPQVSTILSTLTAYP